MLWKLCDYEAVLTPGREYWVSRIFRPGPGHRQAVSQGRHQRHEKHPAQVPRGPLRRGQPRLGSFTVDFKSFSIFQALHMIMLSASSLSFTKDMMEEQIISTEEADLKPGLRRAASSCLEVRCMRVETTDPVLLTATRRLWVLTSLVSRPWPCWPLTRCWPWRRRGTWCRAWPCFAAHDRVISAGDLYLYSSSHKKYSEVKLTSLPNLGLVTSDTEKWSEMIGDNSDVRVSELWSPPSVSQSPWSCISWSNPHCQCHSPSSPRIPWRRQSKMIFE